MNSLAKVGTPNLEQCLIAIYNAYPVRVGRRPALLSIQKAIDRLMSRTEGPMSFEDAVAGLLEACKFYSNSAAGKVNGKWPGYHPPYPTTWFNQSRYLDDPRSWNDAAKPESKTATRERETRDNLDRAFTDGAPEEVSGNGCRILQDCRDRRRRADMERPTQSLLNW